MRYLYLTREQMTSNGINFTYSGLDTSEFIEVRYNEQCTEAVICTGQDANIPEGILEITEDEFNQRSNQWPILEEPDGSSDNAVMTLENVDEKIDRVGDILELLIQMQLEKEGIL